MRVSGTHTHIVMYIIIEVSFSFFHHRTIPIVSILSLTYFGRKSISSCCRWTTVVYDHLHRACRPPTVECSRVHCWCRKPNHLKKKTDFKPLNSTITHTNTHTRIYNVKYTYVLHIPTLADAEDLLTAVTCIPTAKRRRFLDPHGLKYTRA